MSDPRCNCDAPGCPICSAPAHQPWEPAAGRASRSPAEMIAEMDDARLNAAVTNALYEASIESRWAPYRRFVLAFLLSLLGGMFGGVFSALTILHYLD